MQGNGLHTGAAPEKLPLLLQETVVAAPEKPGRQTAEHVCPACVPKQLLVSTPSPVGRVSLAQNTGTHTGGVPTKV